MEASLFFSSGVRVVDEGWFGGVAVGIVEELLAGIVMVPLFVLG